MRAILVLGKELRRFPDRARRELLARSAAAAVAWRTGGGLVLTLEARLRGQERSGSELVHEHLLRFGVPSDRIVRKDLSRSTREEAILAHREMRDRGLRSLLAITHDYHLDRVRSMVEALGVPARTVAPTSMLRKADAAQRAAILAAVPGPEVFAQERSSERAFSALAGLLRPFPRRLRWGLEVRAGALLRRHDG